MRKVIVMLEVDDNRAINEGLGTIDYVEKVGHKLEESGLFIQNARILDDDDENDVVAIQMANEIFEG